MPNRAAILKQQFHQSVGSPWQDILPASRLEAILVEEEITYRNCVYTPIVTLWAMIAQVLDPDKSLSHAVKQMITWLSVSGAAIPSADTGAYSKARTRLSESLLLRLIPETSEQLEQQVAASQQWCGRRARVCDGTTVLMSDTAANQAVYPQHGNQAPGCGFPIAKLVVIFSLLTGAVVSASIGDWHTSEIVLSRLLYADLAVDDVLVADQAYGSYLDLALVQQQQADGVFRKHHARHTDFRRGRKSGIGDHQVTWQKPKKCPEHMTEADFEAVPATLVVREVCLRLSRRGWRDEPIIVVTTLLDAKRYSAQQLTQLYGWRWAAAEVNLRHLKTSLKLEMLTAKTPEMVRKDLWAHLLAYNLLRAIMEQAAPQAQYQRARLSLQATRQQFNSIIPLLAHGNQSIRRQLNQLLLQQIAMNLLPLRPHRQEPRVVKRRPKPFPRMKQSRSILKAKLVA
jgi:Transposase DDE domain